MNKKIIFSLLALIPLWGWNAVGFAKDDDGWPFFGDDDKSIAEYAQDVRPLYTGEEIPDGPLRSPDRKTVDLDKMIAQKPTILIFYQGSWSPYSNNQLAQLVKIEPILAEMGFQVAAISPDRPSRLAQSIKMHKINYSLYSDRIMDITEHFGLAYQADDNVLEELGIHLRDFTGNTIHVLPIPAAYGINQKGIIQFCYFNSDYRYNFDPELLIDSAKKMLSQNQ